MTDEQPQRPTNDDRDAWRTYWQAQRIPWRTEPEIDEERQAYLAERRAAKPNIEQGMYPFKDIKLTRADVEWLLAAHESRGVSGPVWWERERAKPEYERRVGLDLRGADLMYVNLAKLPLACVRGGLAGDEWGTSTLRQRSMAGVHMEGATLTEAQLQRCVLTYALKGLC